MGIKVITPASEEPITEEMAWQHLRLVVDLSDSPPEVPEDRELIAAYLGAAREAAEQYTGRTIAPATLELALDAFPDAEIELGRGPVRAITSVSYVDEEGAEQTIDSANFVLDTYGEQAWLLPADGFEWPSTSEFVNAVKIRYTAGYSLPGDSPQTWPLPKSMRAAILLALGDLYEHREETIVGNIVQEIPTGVKALLAPFRLEWGV